MHQCIKSQLAKIRKAQSGGGLRKAMDLKRLRHHNVKIFESEFLVQWCGKGGRKPCTKNWLETELSVVM